MYLLYAYQTIKNVGLKNWCYWIDSCLMFEEDRCKNLSNECEGKMLPDFFLIYKIVYCSGCSTLNGFLFSFNHVYVIYTDTEGSKWFLEWLPRRFKFLITCL